MDAIPELRRLAESIEDAEFRTSRPKMLERRRPAWVKIEDRRLPDPDTTEERRTPDPGHVRSRSRKDSHPTVTNHATATETTYDIPVDISMTFAVVRVKFLSATHQYPCDVEETSVSTGQIECYTRAMPAGVYTPQVTLCSSADDCQDIPCLGEDEQDCKFETKTHYTPYIKSVTPTSGYPGNRGVYREVWEYDESSSIPALTDLPVGEPTESTWIDSFSWTNRSESYFSRVRGFFIPPNDNDYQFVLQDCVKASDDFVLYLSPSGPEDEPLDVLECPDSGRRWSERYTLTGGKSYYMEVRYRHDWSNDTQKDLRGVAMKMFHTDYVGGQNYHAQNEKQEIKITSTVVREKQRIVLGNDVQDFTLEYGGVQSETIQAGASQRQSKKNASLQKRTNYSTLFQMRRAIEQMLQTVCPDEVANPNQAIRLFVDDYEGERGRPETGSRSKKNASLQKRTNYSTLFQMRRAIEQMLQTVCPDEVANPNQAIRLFVDDYEGERGRPETGSRVEADETEPFCGKQSLKNPSHLYRVNRDHNLNAIDPNMDKVMCFAYKGNMASKIGFRFRYDSNGEREEETAWFGPENDTSLDFAADREWKYTCINLQALFSNLRPLAPNVRIQDIQVASEEEDSDDDFFIDNVFIGKVEPMPAENVASSRRLAAQLGGTTVKEVEVDRVEGGYDVTFIPYNCGHSFPLMQAQVDGTDLTGNDVKIELSNNNNGGLWFYPIPGDMLRTWHDKPQVEVSINNIPSRCEGDCSFSWATHNTPTVTSVNPTEGQGGTEVNIVGTGFSAGCDNIRVVIGHTEDTDEGVACEPAICTSDNIQCTGGVELNVTGHGFADDDVPMVGGKECDVVSRSNEEIVCVVPPGSSGGVAVTVNGAGGAAMTAADSFTYDAGLNPTITAYSPSQSSVTGGETLTIEGSGFGNQPSVFLRGSEEIVEVAASGNGSSITCTLPALGPGTYDILLHVDGAGYGVMQGSTTFPTIEYVLSVTGVSPSRGSLSDYGNGYAWSHSTLTIEEGDTVVWNWSPPTPGVGFAVMQTTGLDGELLQNGFSSGLKSSQGSYSYTFNTVGNYYYTSGCVDEDCDIQLPGKVEVIKAVDRTETLSFKLHGMEAIYSPTGVELDPSTTSSSDSQFSFVFRNCFTATVTSLSPTHGTAGETITIQGTGFSTTTCENEVLIGGYSCDVTSATSNSITCTVNPGSDMPVGTYLPVSVNIKNRGYARMATPGGEKSRMFALLPKVMSVSPEQGSTEGGAQLTIIGSGFASSADSTTCTVGTVTCDIQSISYNEIICVTRAASERTRNVTVSQVVNGYRIDSVCDLGGNAGCQYAYRDSQTPRVYTINPPTSGSATVFTITGTLFGTSVDAVTVTFGETTSCDVTSVTDGVIFCSSGNIPVGDQPISVHVAGQGNAASSVVVSSQAVIHSMSPTEGSLAGGTTLTITGNGFDSDTEITMNGEICEILSVNLSTVTCIAPAATSENDHLVQVSVVSNGQAYPPQGFTYSSTLTPNVAGITPAVATSGTSVTISGSGFGQTTGDNEVTIDGAPCAVGSSSDTEIVCTLGDHVAGSDYIVDVTVASKGMARSGVTFSYELSLLTVTPSTGSFGGGRTLTLTGTGFAENATVTVCGHPCPISSVVPNLIECEVPAHDGSDCIISGVPSETEVVCVTEAHSGSVNSKVRAVGTDGIATQDNADFYYVDRWSSVYTWGGDGLPVAGDFVIVQEGQTLLLDTDTPILRMLLIQGGTLLFHDEGDVHLQSEYILITDGGTLQIGTEEEPFQHQAIITLHGHLRSKELPIYGAKVLGLRNGTLDIHGSPVPVTWTRLAQTASTGATTLVVEQPVTWKAGDSIAIATTGYRHSQTETEVREIASVDPDGVTITLTEPLEYEHISVEETFPNSGVTLETRGEVALLTRNVVIRGSDDPSWHDEIEACEEGFDTGEFATQTCFQGRFGEEVGSDQFGGHVLIHQPEPDAGLVTARIEHVEFTYVGQAFRLGRYPIHSHLNGDMSSSYVRGCAIHHSFNRAVTMHGTHNLLVERNVVFNIMGGAFFIEDGIETGNIVQYNLALFVRASTSLLNDDITPAGYWVTNPNNTIRHNHAAGGTHFGFWYRMHEHPDGASYDPDICPQRVPLGVFQNNTVHSQGWFGLWVFQEYYPAEGGSCGWGAKPEPAVFRGFTAWRNEKGAEWVNVGAVQFEDFVVAYNELAGIEMKRILRLSEWGFAKITNAVLIGHGGISTGNNECTKAGLVLPFARYLTISGAKMINFDRAGCAAFEMTSITGTCSDLCAGFPYKAERVEYFSTPNKANFRWEHEGWIEDLDGSVTETVGGTVIPSSATLPPTCAESVEFSAGRYPGSVCTDPDLRFHRFAFKDVQPDSLDMRNAILKNEYGNTSVPWAMKRMTHKPGWMLVLVGKSTYTFSFQDSSHITNLTYSGKFYDMEDTDYIIMQHKFTQTPDSFSLAERGDDHEESPAAISYTNNEDKDWYFDEENEKTFSYIVSGKGESSPVDRGVKMQVYRCFYEDCIPPADPNDVPPDRQRPEDYVIYTELAWKMDTDGFMVPSSSVTDARNSVTLQENDDVKIMGVSWLVLGDEDLPKLGKLYIYTVLELWDPANPYTRDYTLEATHIFIQGGRLIGGWPDNPYLGNIHIILHGDHNTPEMPVPNGPNVGAKAIGVFGGLDLFGKTRSVCWTHLAQTAAAGADTITLADVVDWQVDEEIVITTTSFDAWQTETFKITDVSTDGRTLTLNSSLAYEHIYHSDTVNGKTYTMAAEVGLLTRNIKIEGADYQGLFSESFGARVLVGSFNTGGQTYTGYARIKNVEFYHTGQEGWNAFYDPRFSLAFVNTGDVSDAKPSLVENNAFHNGFSPGIGVYGTNKLEIVNNIVHHTVGQGMIIEGSWNSLTRNLIALSIWPGAYQDRKEENSEKWEAALEIMDATNIVLKDNVIAGAERVGVHLDGEPCPGVDNPVDSWSGNVIHSDVTFSNFGEACGGQQDVAFHTWNSNEDLMHPIETEGLHFVDVDENNIAFIGRPSLGKINPADCVDMECDGKKETFIKDRDGTFLPSGVPGALIPQAEWEWDEKDYLIHFSGVSPQNLRLQLLNTAPDRSMVIGIYYSRPERLDVYLDGSFVEPKNFDPATGGIVAGNHKPTLSDEPGANFMDIEWQTLFFTLTGSSSVTIKQTDVIVLTFGMPPVTVEDFFSSDQLVNNLCLFLNIPADKVRVMDVVREDSSRRRRAVDGMNVVIQIGEPPTQYLNGTADNSLSYDDLLNLTSTTVNAVQTGELDSVFGTTVASVSVVDPIPPVESQEWRELTVDRTLTDDYVMPGSLLVHTQPEPLHEMADFAVQPKIQALDKDGKHMLHLGHVSAPWQVTASLQEGEGSDQRATLHGTLSVPYINGWANFTDLKISHRDYVRYEKVNPRILFCAIQD
uniref:Fibrocystin-L-like n=1 Tax=Branchiostoma floridae TaxID=7739 RepID=C3XUL6_BRAFL|eukprot:XP_002612206.1 hypothetical protein BRAFLDRAFT_108902 [Branchiostoma floridae]